MRGLIVTIIITVFLAGCGEKQENAVEIPEGMLSPEKMEAVLVDVQLVEGALVHKRSTGKKYQEVDDYYFNAVFKKHGLTQKEFKKNLEFYKDHPDLLREVYLKVIEDLEALNKELNNK